MAMSGGLLEPVLGRAQYARPAGIDIPLAPEFPPVAAARRPLRRRLARCPEIDCLRHILPRATLAAAELRAAEIGAGADRVLVTAAHISEDDYVEALADWLAIPVEHFDNFDRRDCPFSDDRLIEAAPGGILPLRRDGELLLVIAPRGFAARRLTAFLAEHPDAARRVRVTTPERIDHFIARYGMAAIGWRAAHALQRTRPDFSAAERRAQPALVIGAAAVLFAGFFLAPRVSQVSLNVALALIFLCWTALRLIGALTSALTRRRQTRISDDKLPVYTIIVPLYREAAALEELVTALAALDYPAEKLDIKLVVEPDDAETLSALDQMILRAPFEIVIAPAFGPRTKPKALNAALPFARGAFVAIYDAEDRPERDQLRLALQAFRARDERLACVQARLTIDNTEDSWLTRLFTAEYAGLFDIFLPGIAAWRLPLPLGGSSNHFRTAVLRKVGAWDPYNVTEDADLGMRLARLGYRTAMIESATYEEAPSRFVPWLKQRTRWFKGWMQTWFVHMRHPRRLLRELGLAGFVAFQLVVGGTVLAALVHLVFALALAWQLAAGFSGMRDNDIGALVMASLYGTTLVGGYAISGLLGMLGLAKRRLLHCGWWLLLMPLYWLLLSVAAWRAVIQLIRDPYRWEKTEHGLARSSRRAAAEALRA